MKLTNWFVLCSWKFLYFQFFFTILQKYSFITKICKNNTQPPNGKAARSYRHFKLSEIVYTAQPLFVTEWLDSCFKTILPTIVYSLYGKNTIQIIVLDRGRETWLHASPTSFAGLVIRPSSPYYKLYVPNHIDIRTGSSVNKQKCCQPVISFDFAQTPRTLWAQKFL